MNLSLPNFLLHFIIHALEVIHNWIYMRELHCENEQEIVHSFPSLRQTPHIGSLKLVIVYLYHGNWQLLQIRAFPPKDLFVKHLAAYYQLYTTSMKKELSV